ncbi:MAG: cysteine dioxygenase family protein [Planctomycetota bacterium]
MATTHIKPGCDAATACRKFPKLAELIHYLDGLSGRADLRVLSDLLARTAVTRADIADACEFGQRSYRRNTIASSAYFELLALCWRSGHCTPIHDHHGSSCAFRVVEGVGTEIRFEHTPSGQICPTHRLVMQPGYICAAEDSDVHQVANLQEAGRDLITLHIYSTPILAMHTYAGLSSPGAEQVC